MAVEFWTGGPFKYPHERFAQEELEKSLAQYFAGQPKKIFAAFNFTARGADIDLLVLKRDGIIIIDFKECGEAVHATENGQWQVKGGGALNGNPFQQIKDFRYALRDYLFAKKSKFLRKQKADSWEEKESILNFIRCVVTMCPRSHPGSTRDIPNFPWFFIKGLDELPAVIEKITSQAFSLDEDEILTLVKDVLHCDPLIVPSQTPPPPPPPPRSDAHTEARSSTRKNGGKTPPPREQGPKAPDDAKPSTETRPRTTPEQPVMLPPPPSGQGLFSKSSLLISGALLVIGGGIVYLSGKHASDNASQQVFLPAPATVIVTQSGSQPGSLSKNVADNVMPKPKEPTREERFRTVINSNLGISSTQRNVALLVSSAGNESVGEALQGFISDPNLRLIANLADVNTLKASGFWEDLYGGDTQLLREAIRLSGVNYIVLANASYSFRSQAALDPDLITCDLTLNSKLVDPSGTVVQTSSFSVGGAGFTQAKALEAAAERAAPHLKEKILNFVQ